MHSLREINEGVCKTCPQNQDGFCRVTTQPVVVQLNSASCPEGKFISLEKIKEQNQKIKAAKDEKGRKLWEEFHHRAYEYTGDAVKELQWLEAFAERLDVSCSCKEHYKKYLVEVPPVLASREDYQRWQWELHNVVNRKLKKPELSFEMAEKHWWKPPAEPSEDKAIQTIRASAPKPATQLKLYNTFGEAITFENFYRGRSLFLICSGPSLNSFELDKLSARGIVTMGVNNSWSVYRPNLWVSVDSPMHFVDVGWKDAGILKFVPAAFFKHHLKVKEPNGTFRSSQFKVEEMPSVLGYVKSYGFNHQTFLDSSTAHFGCGNEDTDSLGLKGGRSVMLIALRLAYYLGFRSVYLVGADFKMSAEAGYAFAQSRTDRAVSNNNSLYGMLNKRFDAMKPHFKDRGFSVFNCTPESGLKTFPFLDFSEAIKRASRECGKPIDTEGWYDVKPHPKGAA